MMETGEATGWPVSIPRRPFEEVFRLHNLDDGCRRIVRSLEEAEVFTERASTRSLLPSVQANSQLGL